MVDILLDNFIDTNGIYLSAHIPNTFNTGTNWTQNSTTSFQIQGNVLQSNRNVDGDLAFIESGLCDMTLISTVIPYNNGTNVQSFPGLVFRYQDANNFWYAYLDSFNGHVYVYSVLAGVSSKCIDYSVSLTSGVAYTLRVDCYRTNITLYFSGIEIVTYVSSSLQYATKVGVRYGRANSPTTGAIWQSIQLTSLQGSQFNWPVYIKNPANPIVSLGTGSDWDLTDINNPNVSYDAVNNRYALMYTGYQETGAHTFIQHAGMTFNYGTDLNNNWVKYAGNPVMPQIPAEGYYNFNGGFCKKGSTWYHLYGVSYLGGAAGAIALATSTDLITWTRQGTVFTPNASNAWEASKVFDAFLRLREDGVTFEMWYGSRAVNNNDYINFAISTDCINWTRSSNNPIISTPAWASGWATIGEPSVFVPQGKEGRELLLNFDSSYLGATGNRFISQALTIDGGNTWHYRVAATRQSTGWEAAQNFDSFSFQQGNNLLLFYGGAPFSGPALDLNIQIGTATASWPYGSLALRSTLPVTRTMANRTTASIRSSVLLRKIT